MGYKKVCLECRKAFGLGTDFFTNNKTICSTCGKKAILFPHRFRPPKKTDDKKWKVVSFLVLNGFKYQSILNENSKEYVIYPENLREAKAFVKRYKAYVEK